MTRRLRASESTQAPDLWWEARKGRIWESLLPYVEKVERTQSATFDRFVKLDALYDPYAPGPGSFGRDSDRRDSYGLMQENVIASNCDAITGTIAATEVRARFMTDGADWSVQRTARQLDWYAEGLSKQLELDEKCRRAFHAGALKGSGFVEVGVDGFDQIYAEYVPVDEIVMEEAAHRKWPVPHLARRMIVPRDVLAAEYPDHAKEIREAQTGSKRGWKRWAGYRPINDDHIVVIKAWRLPLGPKGHPRYVAGKEVVCIDGHDLRDRPYEKPYYPLARFAWTERPNSPYGIGGAERIIGHQRKLNRRNLQFDRTLDQFAFPTTWVQLADANIAVKTTSRLGTIGVYKSAKPETVIPQAISGDAYRDKADTRALSFEEFGQSRMSATAMKPAGLDSGVALREHKDQTTERFATQEEGHETLKLSAVFLAIDAAKSLGKNAPTVVRQSKFGSRKIPWAKVDLKEVKVQITAASTLGRTPAGRTQFVMEMAQAGIISQDSARRLLLPNGSLDVEAEMSRYVAALEDIERTIDEIEDGAYLVPEPYQHLEIGIWRMQAAYLQDRANGAPEEVLESLRAWIVSADHMLSLRAAPAEQGAAPPLDPAAAVGAPAQAPPVAALADQAMQLRAV